MDPKERIYVGTSSRFSSKILFIVFDSIIYFLENYSIYGVSIELTRVLSPYILSVYLPSAMFVTMSWVRTRDYGSQKKSTYYGTLSPKAELGRDLSTS